MLQPIILDLPIPPSANAIWRRAGHRIYLNPTYVKWMEKADAELLRQRIGKGWTTLVGKFEATLTICRKKLRTNADLDNRFKPAADWAQKAGLIENDKNLVRLVLEFGEAPLGARLEIRPHIS